MDTRSPRDLESLFPKLASTPCRITSPLDTRYNCIAWAAGDTTRWWEPDEDGYYHWPTGAARLDTVDAYIQAFEVLGYERCHSRELEPGFQKVAIFADETGPTHAAKQLDSGNWSSKLGVLEDIEHELEALTGDEYGEVVRILRRAKRGFTSAIPAAIPIADEAARDRMTERG